jgi:hypothetical protein
MIREALKRENKIVKPGDPSWDWEMTRTIAALYNYGGGVLRAGIDDHGKPVGFTNTQDYQPDKSALTSTLGKSLTRVPPFCAPTQMDGYIEVRVKSGVTFPVILKKLLEEPNPKNPNRKKYLPGTVFTRAMEGNGQVSSRPPQNTEDWQTLLHLWEMNRGVTIQGTLVAQFCLVINKWDPFNLADTGLGKWEAKCVADTAKTLGRDKLWDGLVKIWEKMQSSTEIPSLDAAIRDRQGSDYKQPLLAEVKQLCKALDLNPVE